MEHGGKGFQRKQASLEEFMPHLSKMVLLLDLKVLSYLSNNLVLFCKEKWFYLEITAKANKSSVLGEKTSAYSPARLETTGFLSTILLTFWTGSTGPEHHAETKDAEDSFQRCHHFALHAGLSSESQRLTCFLLLSGGFSVCHHTQLSTGS